jgi:hypothetical protein
MPTSVRSLLRLRVCASPRLGLFGILMVACAAAPTDANARALQASHPDPAALLPGLLSGVWRITYENGAVRTYVFQPDGVVQFLEAQRQCAMCVRPEILLAFNDGKIELLSLDGEQLRVQHWDPGTGYPDAACLRGVGQRVRPR